MSGAVGVGWGNLDQNWTDSEIMFKTPEKENELVTFSFMESLKDRKQYRHDLNFTILPVAYPIGKCFRFTLPFTLLVNMAKP